MSGYQLAKRIDLSRPSIYNALERMYERGIILSLPESASTWVAENPRTLFGKLAGEYGANAERAAGQLERYAKPQSEERLLNFRGLDTAVAKTKEMLSLARTEVFINADFDLDLFRDDIATLAGRGVRVIVFSFIDIGPAGLAAEIYSHRRARGADWYPSRLMVVVDGRETLVADTNRDRDAWVGSVTNNPLMISIVSEHIHHDIYLLKLRERKGSSIFDDGIRVHTEFEKARRQETPV